MQIGGRGGEGGREIYEIVCDGTGIFSCKM